MCLIPNRGARIGHQTYEHFLFVAYCELNGFHFVYTPFWSHSKEMGSALHFERKCSLHLTNIITSMTQITLKDLKSFNIHEELLQLHAQENDFLLLDHICGNENINTRLPGIPISKCIEVRTNYRLFFKNSYPSPDSTPYVCIHIRRGDIVNNKSRVLDIDYFIKRYNELLIKAPISDMPIYVLTEANFNETDKLMAAIPRCNIIKCSEVQAFYYLVNSSYLIASRSGFSNLAYILGGMKVMRPPEDWNLYWDNLIE